MTLSKNFMHRYASQIMNKNMKKYGKERWHQTNIMKNQYLRCASVALTVCSILNVVVPNPRRLAVSEKRGIAYSHLNFIFFINSNGIRFFLSFCLSS